jgi:hypothetical protein
MPASLWELILRAFRPFRHVADVRIRDARRARRDAEAKLEALERLLREEDKHGD